MKSPPVRNRRTSPTSAATVTAVTQRARGGLDFGKPPLGEEQYRWLARSLAASRAMYKLIFIHQPVGGATPKGRGGAEAAPFFEWGGKNPDGTDGVGANRPGWPAPVHRRLVDHGPTAVFHGHDHLDVNSELDGGVYQKVPPTGTRGNNAARNAEARIVPFPGARESPAAGRLTWYMLGARIRVTGRLLDR